MEYGFFENPQSHNFYSRLASTRGKSRVASNWTQQPSTEFDQPPLLSGDTAYYLMDVVTDQYSAIQQHHYSSPAEHLTPSVALTLQSRQSISPAWIDNQPLPPYGTGLSTTPTGSVTFQTSLKQVGKRTQGKARQRKRQKSETDMSDDDDVVKANVGAIMPHPSRQ